ncbi:MAG: phospholipase [Nitrospinae bacterium CG11_big_fil_rev_8_21_14_0_20_45_15]|nr:MAG: phospholipase [Nitrospinae bacterium CG11_big_fil_rev_8_21_14_0_20_45_15]
MAIQYKNTEWDGKKIILGDHGRSADSPLKLLIGFHGADSTPENMLILGNKLQLKNALTVYPEAPIDAGKGLWSWWKDGPKQLETVHAFMSYADRIIDSAIHTAKNEYQANDIQVCLWGFSQGGAAALVYSIMGNHPISKTASVCGFLPELPETNTSKPPANILGIFGLNDNVVPSFMAEYALDECSGRGHKTDARETKQGHEVTAENLAQIELFFND